MVTRLKEILKEIQSRGLPIVILRDTATGLPSITFSFFVLSGTLVTLGLIGKFAKLSGGIDMDNALAFFYACSATYLGRKITAPSSTAKPKSKVDTEGEDDSSEK